MSLNNGKLEVVVKFFSNEEGGRRNDNPACLIGNRYRPHFVVSSGTSENLIGVMFESGTERATPDKEWMAIVVLIFQPRDLLPPNTLFQIIEGSKIVGEGRVTKWLS